MDDLPYPNAAPKQPDKTTVEVPEFVNLELEASLIGVMMFAATAAWPHVGHVEDADFAHPWHSMVWRAIRHLVAEGREADPLTVSATMHPNDEKQRREAGVVLARYATTGMASARNAPSYAAFVRLNATRRRIAWACQGVLENIAELDPHDGDADVEVAKAVATLTAAAGGTHRVMRMSQVGASIVANRDAGAARYRTGLRALDRALMGGLFAGRTYGFGARPKVGKTTLACTLAYNLAVDGIPTLDLCLEMGAEQVGHRLYARAISERQGRHVSSSAFLSDRALIRSYYPGAEKMTRSMLDPARQSFDAEFAEAKQYLDSIPLYFFDKPRLSLSEVKSTIAQCVYRYGIKVVILDYLQLVTGQRKQESRTDHLDNVAQSFAELCKEYGLAGVAFAQLNSEGRVRGGDGLLNACDVSLAMTCKVDEGGDPIPYVVGDRIVGLPFGISINASRYTHARDLGGPDDPWFFRDDRRGPFCHDGGKPYEAQAEAVANGEAVPGADDDD
jgi:replicative DNA helicase